MKTGHNFQRPSDNGNDDDDDYNYDDYVDYMNDSFVVVAISLLLR